MTENQSEQRRTYVVKALNAGGEVPSPRGGATLTQVESGSVYLIGGANREAQSFNDVFRIAAQEWSLVLACDEEFHARSGHSAVAVGSRIYVFGGMDMIECALYGDVMIFDTVSQHWTKPTVDGWMPRPRNAHTAIRLPSVDSHDRILIYGGSSPEEGTFDDVYVLHIPRNKSDAPLRWEHRNCDGAEIPEARELQAATFLDPTTILFSGGRNKNGNVCTDMALLKIDTWKWQLVPICEWNRCSHVACSVGGAVVSFGGFDGSAIRNDCWEYADDEETWVRVVQENSSGTKDGASEPVTATDEAIVARFGHCGCSVHVSETRKRTKHPEALLVFGGMNSEQDLNDLVLILPRET